MPFYDYLTPKLDFKRKFNHRQSFLYKGRLTVRTIRKFRTGSSVRIESRIGSSINLEASQVTTSYVIIIVIIKFVWSHVRSCILDKAIMVVLISVKLLYT